MRKFFVIFCQKNMHKPSLYISLKTVTDKIKENPQLVYEEFTSELEAEKFIYPKKINFFVLQQEMKNQGIDISNMEKIQENKKKIKTVQDESQTNTEKQAIINGEKISKEVVQPQQKASNKEKTEIDQLLDFNQVTLKMKSAALREIEKENIKKAYDQVVDLCGSTESFVKSQPSIRIKKDVSYTAFFDGCSKGNPGPSGGGFYVVNPMGEVVLARNINFGYKTNNQAEYLALIFCLLDCKFNGIDKLHVTGDSELVINGLKQLYKIESKNIKYFNIIAKSVSKLFSEFSISHVPRELNAKADKLSNDGLKSKYLGKRAVDYL